MPSIETILARAVDIPDEAARRAYLAAACGADAALRGRVERLVAAHFRAGDFLECPVAAPADTTSTVTFGSPPSAAQRPGPVAGTVVAGRYQLIEQVGEGGMGTVWLAEQREPVRRRVALKLIRPGMDSTTVLARFEAERQALALMDHPHIAKVLDGGTAADGRPFFVMELVRGLPLTEYCDQRRLGVRDRLALFAQVCRAVQHAHQKGVIHRDLKPSNVLVTEHDGKPVPKVIDFGLAKALHAPHLLTDRTLHTAHGGVVGTPLYMAPEQVGINALDVDTRADVYALGVVLYELLTGTTPIDRTTLRKAVWDEVRRLIRDVEPPRPSARLSASGDLPALAASRGSGSARLTRALRGELDWVVMKALEKDRGRRYETAAAFAADVDRYLANEVVEARPPSIGYRLRKLYRRNRAAVLTAGLVVAALVSGVLGTSLGLSRALDERAKAGQARQTAEENEARAVEAGDRLRQAQGELWASLYASRAAQIQTAWDAADYGRVRDLLAAQVPPAGQRDLRGFEWHYLDRLLRADLRTVRLPRTSSEDAPISPDGRRVLRFVREAGGSWLRVLDTATGDVVRSFRLPASRDRGFNGGPPSFSPDGQWIVAAVPNADDGALVGRNSGYRLRRWNAATGEEDPRARDIEVGPTALAGAGGTLAVFAAEPVAKDGLFEYRVWDGSAVAAVRAAVPREPMGFGTPNFSAVSPDGAVIAARGSGFGGDQWVALLETRTGRSLTRDVNPEGTLPRAFGVAFSADGRRVALAGDALTVWNVSPCRKVLEVAEPRPRDVPVWDWLNSPAFSPDGTRIAYVCGPAAKIVDAATGRVRRVLVGHDGGITNLAFSRDGAVLVTTGGDRVKHWDATLDEGVPVLPSRMDPLPGVPGATAPVGGDREAPTPDAARLIRTAMVNGSFTVWGRGTEPVFVYAPPPSRFEPRLPAGPPLKTGGPPNSPSPAPVGWSGPLAVLRPDGRRAAMWRSVEFEGGSAVRWESEVHLFDPDAGRHLLALERLGHIVQAEFSPDNRWLVAVAEPPGEVIVWDAETGRARYTWSLPPGQGYCPVFSSGGRLGVIGQDATKLVVRLWEAGTGTPVTCADLPLGGWDRQQSAFLRPALSAGGTRAAAVLTADVGPGLRSVVVRVWDTEIGGRVVDLPGPRLGDGMVRHLAFSPDGRRLASASGDRGIQVWDPESGDELLRLPTAGEVFHLAFAPDGQYLQVVLRTPAGFEARWLDGRPQPPSRRGQ